MFHLNEYKNRFRIPVSEWNKLARFINNLAGGNGIRVTKPDEPSSSAPAVISLGDGETDVGIKNATTFFVSGYSVSGDSVTLRFSKMTIKNGLITKIETDHDDPVYQPVELMAY